MDNKYSTDNNPDKKETGSPQAAGRCQSEAETPVHRRRPHYSGRYPKKFEEKYKELDPERYAETIGHVISKGSTPAGMHIPIMAEEILAFLDIRPGQKGLDCTLGYGGHSSRMAAALQGNGHLYALDADPIEIEKTRRRMKENGFGEDIFTAIHTNFRNLKEIAEKYGPFDFLLADLGVSSMQLDNPERGFSYKTEGPLDLRFDPTQGESAAERLRSLDESQIEDLLIENSDEPYADVLAKAVVRHCKKGGRIETTSELRAVIETAIRSLPARKLQETSADEAVKKSCARVFQALRIDVNSELDALYEFLEALPGALSPGGKAAILTFHSGEDRLVKQFFRTGKRDGRYSETASDVIRPGREECRLNPRARSTKMRWAVR